MNGAYRSFQHARAVSMLQRWSHLFGTAVGNFAVIIDSVKRQREVSIRIWSFVPVVFFATLAMSCAWPSPTETME